MEYFILAVVMFCLGVFIGRVYEFGKHHNNTISERPLVREAQYDQAHKQGYYRAKMKLPYTMTLDEAALALHRIEGLAKTMLENTSDMKQKIGQYGAESTETDEQRG